MWYIIQKDNSFQPNVSETGAPIEVGGHLLWEAQTLPIPSVLLDQLCPTQMGYWAKY